MFPVFGLVMALKDSRRK